MDKQAIAQELDKELAAHDPNTVAGLAYWQAATTDAHYDINQEAGPLAASIITGQRTFADLNADETALLLGLLANLSNLINLFILYPRRHLQELLAEVTPQYTADENLEA
jgi:hypothetical protein